jgi:hypothetical protein
MMRKEKKEIQFEQPSNLLLLANRYVLFIMALIVVAILVAGYFFVLKPRIDTISSVELQNTETEERRIKNELLLTKLKELEAEYEDIMNNRQEDLASLKKIVPQGSQVAEFFLIADRLAKKQDFVLLNIDVSENLSKREAVNPLPAANEIPEEIAAQAGIIPVNNTPEPTIDTIDDLLAFSGIKSMIVSISVSKTITEDQDILGIDVYNDFKDYVAELENNIRLLDVQAINFSDIVAEGEATYIFGLDLITYYQ